MDLIGNWGGRWRVLAAAAIIGINQPTQFIHHTNNQNEMRKWKKLTICRFVVFFFLSFSQFSEPHWSWKAYSWYSSPIPAQSSNDTQSNVRNIHAEPATTHFICNDHIILWIVDEEKNTTTTFWCIKFYCNRMVDSIETTKKLENVCSNWASIEGKNGIKMRMCTEIEHNRL